MAAILHLPVSYLPWTTGGKEVYCHALCLGLRTQGVDSRVAFHQNPGISEPIGLQHHENVPIHVLEAIPDIGSRKTIYSCESSEVPEFAELLEQLRPGIVHFHDFSGQANLRHMQISRRAGSRIVMSFHSPGQSCLQRELWYRGERGRLCDGRIDVARCSACRLGVHGIPEWISGLIAILPMPATVIESKSRIGRMLTVPATTDLFARAWSECIELVDMFQVNAHWVSDLLLDNGVDPEKIRLIRPGYHEMAPGHSTNLAPLPDCLNVAFVGRCDRVKGIDVLIDAVKGLPDSAPIRVHFFGPYWDGPCGELMRKKISGDDRFEEPFLLSPGEVVGMLLQMDVCVVPSLWMETGPLVILEAFEAGIPVFGSRLGGIAEQVRDGVDGYLFEPGNSGELAELLRRSIEVPSFLETLRQGLQKPRQARDVATDMTRLYSAVGWSQ